MAETATTRDSLWAEAGTALRAAGVAEPVREALRIWADLSGTAPAQAFLARAEAVAPDQAAAFLAAIERRAGGEPLAYVTGWAGFRRLTLRIDQRALIPRPETEGLVELVLARVATGVIADVGTGSGCIALSLATEGRYDAVLGVESSTDALALTRSNRALVGARVALVNGDLATPLPAASLDALVSNPPYLSEREHAELDGSVRDWEPSEALVSGAQGLEATQRLLADGRRVVRPGGWLVLEVDSGRAQTVAALAQELGWRDVMLRVDLFGRERYLLARRSERP